MRNILTILVIGAAGVFLSSARAVGQAPVPPPPVQRGVPVPAAGAIRDVMQPAGAVGLDGLLLPVVPAASDRELAGLSQQAPAELLTWDRVYMLALVRARSGGTAAAEALDPQALAEQSRRHGVADFARFRKEFLAGRTETGGTFRDPSGAYFAILRRLQAIDDARVHIATIENLLKLVQELIQGENGGLSQLDVDLLSEALVRGRRGFSRAVVALRDALDELKVELGLSPHAAVIPDRRNLAGFRDTWKAVDVWARRPDRSLAELPRIVAHLPTLGDAIVGGQPILRTIEQAPARMEDIARMEDLLRDTARLAIKNRADTDKAQRTKDGDASLELRVRRRVRHLLELRRDYADQKRSYELAVRLRDQAFERLVSSSSGAGNIPRTPVIQGLVDDVVRLREAEDRLAAIWASFRTERLALYRDLGVLPYETWDAFYADLSAGHGAAEPAPPAAPAIQVPSAVAPAGPPPPPPAPPTTTAPASQP